MILERLEQRCLGAVEFIDAITGARVRRPMAVAADGLQLRTNASGLVVITGASGLQAHTDAFAAAPAVPAAFTLAFTLQVSDRERRYLPRSVQVLLPRRATPLPDAESVLAPQRVPLYPSGARPVDGLWAVLRASVFSLVQGRRVGIANAWLTLTPTLPGVPPIRALTDAQGEALLAVTGVPPIRPASGDDGDPDVVYSRDFNATLGVVLHRDMAWRADAGVPMPLADPDRIETDLPLGAPTVQILNPPVGPLSAGATQRVDVEVTP